jgi:penicillin amidase
MRRTRSWAAGLALALLLAVLVALALVHLTLRASLPPLDGRLLTPGVRSTVTIERDALGIATISAANRLDLAYGTGFAHGQDRFFQMDLARRLAAGELSELVGPAALAQDRKARLFRFRSIAAEVLRQAPPGERALITAYMQGVNAALASLASRPFEYWLLGVPPASWREEDTILVSYSMWWDLQYGDFESERARRELDARLGGARCEHGWKCALAFLYPPRTQWDAPNVATEAELHAVQERDATLGPVPDAQTLDVRAQRQAPARESARPPPPAFLAAPRAGVGSNAWAVAGALTASGAALVAGDMHLSLRVPPVWYRARLRVLAPGADALDLNGVTLPGAPLLVAGSNGQIAWSFTNSYGHWLDLKPTACTAVDATQMTTPDGSVALTTVTEHIRVHGAADELLRIASGASGVLFQFDAASHRCWFARWLAQLPAATNLNLLGFERAASVAEALALAPALGIPHQNLIVGDRAGHIGWTIAGHVPLESTGEARLSGSAGWRTAAEQPHIEDPPLGRVWTANARATDDPGQLAAIGGEEDSLGADYALGARARQIRDDLLALQGPARPRDMLRIQLDDRAVFLARWRELALRLLDPEALAGQPHRAQFRALLAAWDARAAVDSTGYTLVRAFRDRCREELWQAILRSLGIEGEAVAPTQFEEPLWRMVSREPSNLLPAGYPDWRAFLLTELDATIAALEARCGDLARCRWGAYHPVRVRHALSRAVPFLSRLLDMPTLDLPGDHDMPRVQDGTLAASERFAVSPGHESEGYLHIAGGQSGHPLSPYYRAGFLAWARGEPLPFLPGPPQHRLVLSAADAR